jgi:virginiamycin B lyase
MTPTGDVTLFHEPSDGYPGAITAGPDGNLWFTLWLSGKVGRISTTGAITEFTIPRAAAPYGITPGPDGKVWFTLANSFGSLTPAGEFWLSPTKYPAPTFDGIVPGPDGRMWMTARDPDKGNAIEAATV